MRLDANPARSPHISYLFSFSLISKPTASRDFVILWPQYFDARASRLTGRRVSKKLAVKSPTIDEMLDAARAAGFKVSIDPDTAYPRFWWNRTGRLIVEKDRPKSEIIARIAERLKALRAEAPG